jgi:tetratricopeptide (TPR) repeat protein
LTALPSGNKKFSMNRLKQTFLALAVIVFGFAAVYGLSDFLENNSPPAPAEIGEEDLTLQGAKLKGFALGAEGLIADWYWMKSLQYVGDKINATEGDINIDNLKPLNPRLLYPYLDNAATLDPKFYGVYEYGAVVLPTVNAAQAVELVKKGIENNPQDYRFYHHLGYIYWRLGEFEKAAQIYSEGSQVPNAPPFLRMMAAKMKSEGGSRETARTIYRQMATESEDSKVKENAALRLAELDSLDERDAIRAALQNYREKTNRCANTLQEILPLLRPVKLPGGQDFRLDKSSNLVDPSGAPYLLDKQTCDVNLDTTKTKIPFEAKRKQ